MKVGVGRLSGGRVNRRLAAIVATDIVGYSKHMGNDEVGTLQRVKTLRSELLEPNILANGGRVVKTTGDGLLIEFASAIDAVAHAIEIQRALAAQNATLADDDRLLVRVGINLGDIMIDDQDIFGDGVNIAARLEAMAEPGGICISSRIHDLVSGRFDAEFVSLGRQKLKNIADPIVVYNVALEGNPAPSGDQTGSADLALPDKPSIAVLPFDNLSSDPDQDYFSDGMSDDIITDLSKIPELFVTARNSSFVFKGQVVDAKEIGRRLGVRYLLEGSVRRVASRIRINAQLIDTTTDGHIWADRYDGNVEDVFSLQDEMTKRIVDALELAITAPGGNRAATAATSASDIEAYDLMLKARRHFYQFTPDSLQKAKQTLESVLRLDPQYSEAYSLHSYCLFVDWNIYMAEDAVLDKALQQAQKGVELDPTSGVALARLGWILGFLHKHDQAIEVFEKAVECSPSNADVYAYFSEILNYADLPQQGLQMIETGIRLDPLGPPNWDFHRGHSYYKLRRYDDAISAIKQSINRGPNFPVPYLYLAVIYSELGLPDEAARAAQSAVEFNPLFNLENARRVIPHKPDEQDRFLKGLREAGLPQ